MTARRYDVFDTPFGWMGALASPTGLTRTTLPLPTPEDCFSALGLEHPGLAREPKLFASLKDTLVRYFDGEPVSFDGQRIDLANAGPFLLASWTACRSIPRGETRTYSWLAEQAGRPRAYRAAGQSMARNRLPIVIPCHRVVGSDGSLTGFGREASQLDLKRRLLALESAAPGARD